MSTTRVIQRATGPVESVQLAEVIDNPEFELVGVFVYSPDKVGVDAGTLVGRPAGRGTTMDVIKSGIEVPPGMILVEETSAWVRRWRACRCGSRSRKSSSDGPTGRWTIRTRAKLTPRASAGGASCRSSPVNLGAGDAAEQNVAQVHLGPRWCRCRAGCSRASTAGL